MKRIDPEGKRALSVGNRKSPGIAARTKRIAAARGRRLVVERLEDRQLLAVGDFLTALDNGKPAASDSFGFSVATSAGMVVVGSPGENTGAGDAGAAYLFDAATGDLLHTLHNPTPAASDLFGSSVAISGNLIVVGAFQDDTAATDSGSAYVFDAVTGNLLRTLSNPAPAASDYFGVSVAVWGTTIVVGAAGDNAGASDAGSAYLFDAATGILLHTLKNPSPTASDLFGTSVAIWGSSVVVGAIQDDAGATDAGSAYVFDAVTGNLLHTLNNPTAAASDYFGISVGVSDSAIVVGADGDNTGAVDAGAAYVFDISSGDLLHTLDNPAPTASDYFGISVAIWGSTIVVGAVGDDTGATDTGSAYIFSSTTGELLQTINNPSPETSSVFGAVAISPSGIIVGAPLADASATDRGAAYAFDAAITLINQAPSFIAGPDQQIADDVGLQSISDWATAISAGPPDEARQSLTFSITDNTNADIFSGPVTIDSTGRLSFTPRPNVEGTALLTVRLEDSGGTAGGGLNFSMQQFQIEVVKPHRWHDGLPPYAPINRGAMEVIFEDEDHTITSTDVLLIVNYLNAGLPTKIKSTDPIANGTTLPFYDVDGDDSVTATDALIVINLLNAGLGGPIDLSIDTEVTATNLAQPLHFDDPFHSAGPNSPAQAAGELGSLADLVAILTLEETGPTRSKRQG